MEELQGASSGKVAVNESAAVKEDKHAQQDMRFIGFFVDDLEEEEKGNVQRSQKEQRCGEPGRAVIRKESFRKPGLNAENVLEQLHNRFDQQVKTTGGNRLRNGRKRDGVERNQKINRIESGDLMTHVLSVCRQTRLDLGFVKEIAGQKTAEHKEKVDGRNGAEPAGISEENPMLGMQHKDIEKSKRSQELHLV